MNLDLIHEIWKTIKPSIESGDIDEASELLVNVLVDNNFDTDDIKSIFKRDKSIQKALNFYVEKPEDGLYHDTASDDYDDEYEDDYENDGG